MYWRAGVVALVIGLVAACGEFRPVGPDYHYVRHKVQPGETLYSIAFRFGYDYREIAAWNNIPPPYAIWPGEELLIPDPRKQQDPEPGSTADAPAQTAMNSQSPAEASKPPAGYRSKPVTEPPKRLKPPTAAKSAVPPKSAKPENAKSAKPAAKVAKTPLKPHQDASSKRPEQPVVVAKPRKEETGIQWRWPTEGKLMIRFAAGSGRKGVDLGGRIGQPIQAAADGEVVYSGNGLIGYGNLVIIKHDEVFLSAYGHNRRLLVKEGVRVKAGQAIGEMGQHPKSGSILHFEIRRNGKPVDPLLYLPNQPR